MRSWVVLLLLIPAAAGHGGTAVMDETLFIHFQPDAMVIHPAEPTQFALAEPHEGIPSCGSSLQWRATFSQALDAPAPGLVRNASFGEVSPRLTWFIEAVGPDGGPSPLPLGDGYGRLVVDAALVTEQDGVDVRLAAASARIVPDDVMVEGRTVYRLALGLGWEQELPFVAPAAPLWLDLSVAYGVPDGTYCPTTLPGLRAYADAQHLPSLAWPIYDPVLIDDIETSVGSRTVTITVVASSPWGPDRIAAMAPPIVRGSSGELGGVSYVSSVTDGTETYVWAWDRTGAPNGSYRVDVVVQSAQDSNRHEATHPFRLGDEPMHPAPADDGGPDRDAPALLPLLALAAVAMWRRR